MLRHQFIQAPARGVDSPLWLVTRLIIAVAAAGTILLRIGFHEPVVASGWLRVLQGAGVGLLWLHYTASYLRRRYRRDWLVAQLPQLALLLTATILLPVGAGVASVFLTMLALVVFVRFYCGLTHLATRPGTLFLSSFVVMILAGTGLLKLPAAVPETAQGLSLLDALFTSTSAVCVTGLIVRDTAVEFTRFGQSIILLLIQLGGLGIVIFGALFATILGGSISLRQARNLQEVVNSAEGGIGHIDRLVRFVVVATLLAELIGFVALWLGYGSSSMLPEDRRFNALFISVSAFCNAGFAPFTDSLNGHRFGWTTHAVVAPLIVIGGLGFPVLYNVWQVCTAKLAVIKARLRGRRRRTDRRLIRFNLHTKLVLTTTAVLYLVGFGGILLGQFTPHLQQAAGLNVTANAPRVAAIDAQTVFRAALDSSFMSVTTRTAGFTTMDMTELTPTSRFVSMVLMWIGGSPGSTAGGVKTAAIGVLFLTIWATLRGRRETEAFGRSIPDEMVRRAGVLIMLGIFIVSLTILALTVTEGPSFTSQVFEAVSACSTVGLSLGLTDQLTMAGRIVIIIAMFLGRVGPLVMLGILMSGTAVTARYRYPSEKIIVG